MILVQRVQRIIHGVRDIAAADEMYQRVMLAEKVDDDLFPAKLYEASLFRINNLVVQTVSAEADSEIARYMDRVGEGFCAMTLQVEDLREAERHLVEHGVRVERKSESYISAQREDFLDTRYDFTDQDLPGQGVAAGEVPWGEFSDHPAGLSQDASVMIFVPDVAHALGLYERALGSRFLEERYGAIASSRTVRVSLGNSAVSLMEPRTEKEMVRKMTDRQGVGGVHGVFFRVKNLEDAGRYMVSKGVGVVGDGNFWAMPHPRMFFGARFMLMQHTDWDRGRSVPSWR